MATFDRFIMFRVAQPEQLLIHTFFDTPAEENVRLIRVDNAIPGVIDCTYQAYADPAAVAGIKPNRDEFTFPHSTITADVNVILLDINGANVAINPANSGRMNTGDAPIL